MKRRKKTLKPLDNMRSVKKIFDKKLFLKQVFFRVLKNISHNMIQGLEKKNIVEKLFSEKH